MFISAVLGSGKGMFATMAFHAIVRQEYASNPCNQAWTVQGTLELHWQCLPCLPAPCAMLRLREGCMTPVANHEYLFQTGLCKMSTSFSGTAHSLRPIVVVLQLENLTVSNNNITGTLPSSWSNFQQASRLPTCVQMC